MGLFKNVFGGSNFPASEPEAILGILMSVIAADGDISDEEADSFMYLANRTRSLGPMPAQPFWAHVETCKGILRREGPHALMDKCAPMISQEKRGPVFINSCDLIMRDGRVEAEEEQLIESLQTRLSIDDSFAQSAVSFVLTKYNL
jgi:hypothetical protein